MKRLQLIWLVLRRNRLLTAIPVVVAWVLIPYSALSARATYDIGEGGRSFIYASQMMLPICTILWPMAYLHNWVEGDGAEALRACDRYHKSCFIEVALFYAMMALLMLPTMLLGVTVFQLSWLEYGRLLLQCFSAAGAFYFCVMLCGNVTIGAIPVIGYLFFCIAIANEPDLAYMSIIEPNKVAEKANWSMLLTVAAVCAWLTAAGYALDRLRKRMF